ncbi:hypothetical protein SLOPH_1761 [Spraguea lophii 42_110]|uniref:Palmitoyltransferase n=1 Tax=Spraguea lophii (strain 42_110) TaxID=1358809 RepID=S7W8Y0_SPRLO|nr:hypothetical protein SLOPH_1761 [Spraguea lophii 42_110]
MEIKFLQRLPNFILLIQTNIFLFTIIEYIFYDTYFTKFIFPFTLLVNLTSLFLVSFTDPGKIIKEKKDKYINEISFYEDDVQVITEIPYKREILISGEKFIENYCVICNIFQPKKISHCYECNSCIFKRDHHCYLLKNCIGENNNFYFFTFLFTTTILSINFVKYLLINIQETPDTDFYFYLSLLCFESMKLLSILFILAYNIYLKLIDTTSIEFVKRDTALSRMFSSIFKIIGQKEIEFIDNDNISF